MAKANISIDADDIPVIIDALEDSLESYCEDADCESCALRRVVVSTFVDSLFKRAKRVELEF